MGWVGGLQRRCSLGFQYESEREKGRWEGKVGGCEEREERMGGIFFLLTYLTAFSVWNTDEDTETEPTAGHDKHLGDLNRKSHASQFMNQAS